MNKLVKIYSLLFGLALVGCQSAGPILTSIEPKVFFNSMNITGIDFDGVGMVARVDVENTNVFSLPLPKIDWRLFINEAAFTQGTLLDNKSISGHGRTTLDIPFNIGYEGLYKSFSSIIGAKEVPYDIEMDISFPVPFISDKVYKLDFSGVIPIIQMPVISFQGIQRKSLGPTMHFVFNWEIENKNDFAFSIGEFNYDFTVNERQWAVGSIIDTPRLNANSKTLIPLDVSISAVSVVRELVDIINRGSAFAYQCTGNMFLSGDLKGLHVLELPMDLKGNTRIR